MARKAKDEKESQSEFNEGEALDANGQGELPEMPPSSPIGKAGRAYLKIKLEKDKFLDEIKGRMGKASDNLIETMKGEKKESVMVDGYQLSYRHEENDKIAVKAPKASD